MVFNTKEPVFLRGYIYGRSLFCSWLENQNKKASSSSKFARKALKICLKLNTIFV